MPRTKNSHPQRLGIWLIATFKLLKGLLLLAIAVGALSLLHENVAAQVASWINILRVDPDNRFIHMLIKKLWLVDDRKLIEISAGTFFYAGLMLIEGVGLALQKRWAQYLTILATTSLIPLEIYGLLKQFSITKTAVILINAAIVLYLILRVREPSKVD